VEEIPTGEEVLAGTFLLNDQPIIILFHFGASQQPTGDDKHTPFILTYMQLSTYFQQSQIFNDFIELKVPLS
jgi:hypothetical protein